MEKKIQDYVTREQQMESFENERDTKEKLITDLQTALENEKAMRLEQVN